VALWDVLASCERRGSLDSNIDSNSIRVNDVAGLLRDSPGITRIGCNGSKAWQEFQQRIWPEVNQRQRFEKIIRLPSTSPAMASLNFQQKLAAWRELVE
jgi:double-stranded uracil-DNA glycosylase